jgi:hypothetical protein
VTTEWVVHFIPSTSKEGLTFPFYGLVYQNDCLKVPIMGSITTLQSTFNTWLNKRLQDINAKDK